MGLGRGETEEMLSIIKYVVFYRRVWTVVNLKCTNLSISMGFKDNYHINKNKTINFYTS